ncbi:MAG: hypothetical protein M3Y08_06145 [Fibrobacterota bacterium]|nr:hypothetical protein [Fibrobacterota bacterium]
MGMAITFAELISGSTVHKIGFEGVDGMLKPTPFTVTLANPAFPSAGRITDKL